MGRLIDEDDVAKEIRLSTHNLAYDEATADLIDNIRLFVPTAQEWVLCSEHLPEESGYYLVSFESDGGKGRHEKKRWVTVSWFRPDTTDRYGTKKAYFAEGNPIAWMPLPEPYKGERP